MRMHKQCGVQQESHQLQGQDVIPASRGRALGIPALSEKRYSWLHEMCAAERGAVKEGKKQQQRAHPPAPAAAQCPTLTLNTVLDL